MNNNTGPIETRLSVVTWNLWWQFGPWQERAPVILQVLRDLDADVIALQEIWDDETGNYAADLAAALGYHYYHAQSMVMNKVGFGNAILSRWPIIEQNTVELYGREQTLEGRNVIYALIDGPRGKLPVFNTHPNYRLEHSHIRQRQFTEIAQFIDSKPVERMPTILCGDFNADPESHEVRMLTGHTTVPVEGLVFLDAWRTGGDGSNGYTWDNRNPHTEESFEPDRRIDFIFTGHAKARGRGHVVECKLIGNQPVNGIWPSDHFGLLAELRY